jgi:hypothetical protein
MSFVDRMRKRLAVAVAIALAGALAGCGGSSSTTVLTGPGVGGGTSVPEAHVDAPTGDNTTQIVVDSGPAGGFSIGAVNVPYVTVTVCTPGSATDCVTIDHVFLDTGSIGLRILKSAVSTLTLPPVAVPVDSAKNTVGGAAVECYPFVLGAVWGPLASADLHIAGERASALPVQLIDDSTIPANTAPAECVAASNGGLMNTAASLQANGILGVGMLAYDCGLSCVNADYSSGYTLYYSCPATPGASCTAAALPVALQVQNPVTYFPVDNNGTLIALPKLPDLGAGIATGRLVFGIGTQTNNQIAPTATMYFVDPNPAHASYLYFSTTVGSATFPDSYIDSGSNALFFDDATVALGCQNTTGSTASWYCPPAVLHRMATVTDSLGTTGPLAYDVTSADALFSTSSLAFNDLAGTVAPGSPSFVWGLPFFYGRTVYTSIWGRTLSPNGPWNAF